MGQEHEAIRMIAGTLLQAERERQGGHLTREMIAAQVDVVLAMPSWTEPPDRVQIIRELECMHTQSVGMARTLEDIVDHVPWLPELQSEIKWKYWDRYKQLLHQKGWAPASVDSLMRLTDETLGRLENPLREGPWDRRGMVVGHVQSGKTANYTGLICKAVDSGYKLVVVLAGLTNSLRSQTQVRLDEGFLGFDSDPNQGAGDGVLRTIGVGKIDRSLTPDSITHRLENGDFKKAIANQFNINPGNSALLFVVKKNGSVLKNLVEWVRRKANGTDDKGRPYVVKVPLLVIDDEADHGSVNTKDIPVDDAGVPVNDYDPTVTNRRIRELLHCFQQSAYVGYTATPFANIFIHEDAAHANFGEDLFPRSFITNLKAPSDYFGPREIFGTEDDDLSHSVDGFPIVRPVCDHSESTDLTERIGWMPPKHTKHHLPLLNGREQLPASLREALMAFILARAVRLARGQVNQHNSMLIHVTRFVDVQGLVRLQVESEFKRITDRLRLGDGGASNDIRHELRELWDRDFEPTMTVMQDRHLQFCDPVTWGDIVPHLVRVATSTQIMEFNGSAKDALDYDSYRSTGLNVIAIGGDKLARGLTLEGLSVSYFLRASKMYDTLMQMGRWFGYRPGYIDVCRLYTTPDMIEWFGHIAVANEELRREFDHMANVGGKPIDYGLKVRSHPLLLVTSQVKMRHGTPLNISFDGSVVETIFFHRDEQTLSSNAQAATALFQRLIDVGFQPERSPSRPRPEGRADKWEGSVVWSSVPSDQIRAFFDDYESHRRSLDTNVRLIAEYIERQNDRDALLDWTVAVLQGDGQEYDGFPFGSIKLVKRAWDPRRVPEEQRASSADYVVRRVGSPRDEAIDLNLGEYQRAFDLAWKDRKADANTPDDEKKPSKPSQMQKRMRYVRPKTRGLLLIYPLDPTDCSFVGESGSPIIGFAACFPTDHDAATVSFTVNNVYWSQEYGSGD